MNEMKMKLNRQTEKKDQTISETQLMKGHNMKGSDMEEEEFQIV